MEVVSADKTLQTKCRIRATIRSCAEMMKSFQDKRSVNFSADDMYALVKDVQAYPTFVPLCEGIKVIEHDPPAKNIEVIVAEMVVGFKAICESFTSRVTCNSEKKEIFVEYVNGPFKKMEGRWLFHDEPSNNQGQARSIVEFQISYELKSSALGLVMGAMFDSAFKKYADAFARRAEDVYGKR
jgi:coenzyme Q-binding protein COQ10